MANNDIQTAGRLSSPVARLLFSRGSSYSAAQLARADYKTMPFQIQFQDEVGAILLMDAQTGTNGVVDGRPTLRLSTSADVANECSILRGRHSMLGRRRLIWNLDTRE